ncbi:MAG: trypsin-like peptidase domain-containing protein [Arenimonas sp.]
MPSHSTLVTTMAYPRISAFLAVGLLALAFSHPAAAVQVKGEAAKSSTKAAPALQWRSGNFPASGVAKLGLTELAPERIAKLHSYNADDSKIKPMQIGIARDVARDAAQPMPSLKWQLLSNGAKVSRIAVTSPDAFGLRVGVRTSGLALGSELRFSGSSDPDLVTAFATGAQTKRLIDERNLYWTPVTEGETQYIEIYLPKGVLAAPVHFDIISTSHLLTNAKENFVIEKASGSCEVNVICSVAALGTNFVNAKNAVARITFVSGGSTFLCTGTVLNDTAAATQIPYFYTANHCISSQTIASTINTFWNYEATGCPNTSGLGTFTQQTGGAVYLYSDPDTSGTSTANGTDTSFVRLNDAPPAGAFFAGWDSTALGNIAVTAIHHPQGDAKKVSQGTKKSQSTKLQTMWWSSGSTEGGSSGSGLFTIGAGGAYYLRGGLYRGSASCSNTGTNTSANSDDYSRLDVSYPSIQQWLAPTVTNGPTVNHTGPWYNPAESGWGLTWFDGYANNNHFGLMFIYTGTGTPDWYEFAGTWTGSDVHSGNLKKNSGPNFGTTFDPSQVVKTPVGTYTLTFTSATAATLTFTVGGVTRTNIPLTKL